MRAAVPVYQQALLVRALGQQQVALVAGLDHVAVPLLLGGLGRGEGAGAQVQIVPVDLAAVLGNQGRAARKAQRFGTADVLADVFARTGFVVQRPDQRGQVAGAQGGQLA